MKITTDHAEIKSWAEKFRGRPDRIDNPHANHDSVGIRINFPGRQDEAFFSKTKMPQHISWKKFFVIFEEQQLAFEYEEMPSGDPSYAYRFVPRGTAEE